MTKSTLPDSSRTDSFYNTFISVLFGFAASVALQWMVEGFCGSTISWHHWLMFVGVLVLTLHFWLICTSTDKLEDHILSFAFPNQKRRRGLLNIYHLYTLAMTIVFLFPIVLMAKTVSLGNTHFWLAYLILSISSLAYDVIALVIGALTAIRRVDGAAQPDADRYFSLFGAWIAQDAILAIVAGGLYYFCAASSSNEQWLAIIFVTTTTASLLLDMLLLNPNNYFENLS